MATFDSVFERKLRDFIRNEMASQSDQIASGFASDFADYKFRHGVIQGLKMGLDAADVVHAEIYNDKEKEKS